MTITRSNREGSARIMAILAAAAERARGLKAEIVSQEGLTASVGIGPNKLVAKIASDFGKPDGLTVVRPEEVQTFLAPLRRPQDAPFVMATFARSRTGREAWTSEEALCAAALDDESKLTIPRAPVI